MLLSACANQPVVGWEFAEPEAQLPPLRRRRPAGDLQAADRAVQEAVLPHLRLLRRRHHRHPGTYVRIDGRRPGSSSPCRAPTRAPRTTTPTTATRSTTTAPP